jgi:hypothetical protein
MHRPFVSAFSLGDLNWSTKRLGYSLTQRGDRHETRTASDIHDRATRRALAASTLRVVIGSHPWFWKGIGIRQRLRNPTRVARRGKYKWPDCCAGAIPRSKSAAYCAGCTPVKRSGTRAMRPSTRRCARCRKVNCALTSSAPCGRLVGADCHAHGVRIDAGESPTWSRGT